MQICLDFMKFSQTTHTHTQSALLSLSVPGERTMTLTMGAFPVLWNARSSSRSSIAFAKILKLPRDCASSAHWHAVPRCSIVQTTRQLPVVRATRSIQFPERRNPRAPFPFSRKALAHVILLEQLESQGLCLLKEIWGKEVNNVIVCTWGESKGFDFSRFLAKNL